MFKKKTKKNTLHFPLNTVFLTHFAETSAHSGKRADPRPLTPPPIFQSCRPVLSDSSVLYGVQNSCHIISRNVSSSSSESTVLSLLSCCQPFHHLRSHLCHSHSVLPICLIFPTASLSFISDPFFAMGL